MWLTQEPRKYMNHLLLVVSKRYAQDLFTQGNKVGGYKGMDSGELDFRILSN